MTPQRLYPNNTADAIGFEHYHPEALPVGNESCLIRNTGPVEVKPARVSRVQTEKTTLPFLSSILCPNLARDMLVGMYALLLAEACRHSASPENPRNHVVPVRSNQQPARASRDR